MPSSPLIHVSAGVLQRTDGMILLAERPAGKPMAGLWEFPGGKLAARETPETALIRELHEELGITLAPEAPSLLSFVSHDYERFHLVMYLFLVRAWEGEPTSAEGQRLAWVAPADIAAYPLPPADRPLAAKLPAWLAKEG